MPSCVKVGIIDVEIYFPKLFILQSELEKLDNCLGKYTKGLGQEMMSVCSLVEDSVSMAMTVVHRMMKRNNVGYENIGRLEVGTESSVDMSKSIKSYLMQLFFSSNNYCVEGADNINACYGGTAALFNCINWIESSSWDGRLGLVVATDLALYSNDDVSARATGGGGAVCLLIGPDSVFPVDKQKFHYMAHCYDFYKPLNRTFPIVDGKLSLAMYIRSFLKCLAGLYLLHKKENHDFELLSDNNLYALHSPYTKLASKAFLYLCHIHKPIQDGSMQLDIIDYIDNLQTKPEMAQEKIKIEREKFVYYADVHKKLMEPSLVFSKNIGNCYTASIFLCFASFLATLNVSELVGKRIILYSYGSGSLSSVYSLTVPIENKERVFEICTRLKYKYHELFTRQQVQPEYMAKINDLRSASRNFLSDSAANNLTELIGKDTYYLDRIDHLERRFYKLFD